MEPCEDSVDSLQGPRQQRGGKENSKSISFCRSPKRTVNIVGQKIMSMRQESLVGHSFQGIREDQAVDL